MRSRAPHLVIAAATVLVVSACTSEVPPPDDGGQAQPTGETAEVPAPAWLEHERFDDAVGLAWEAVGGAEGYQIHFDGDHRYDAGPGDCEDEVCTVILDRSTLWDIESAEVTLRTVIGGERSADSLATTVVPPEPAEHDEPSPSATVTRRGPDPDDPPEFERVDPEPGESLDETIERLEREHADDDEVVSIDPDARVDPLGAPETVRPLGDTDDRAPPDPPRSGDWAAHDSGLPELSASATGTGVTIAVVEGGDIDRSHPELQQVGPAQGVGDDGLTDASSETSEHATAVVGAILGTDLVVGSAPGAEVRLYDASVDGLSNRAVAWAIVQAALDGADVINVSLSSISRTDGAMQAATDFARLSGAVVITGAGNHAQAGCHTRAGREHGQPTMPAAAEGVLVIGASGRDGTRWDCSVPVADEVLAPGAGVSVLDVGHRLWPIFGPMRHEVRTADGTSYAAPMVAGIAALLLELDPTLTHDRVVAALRATLDGQGVVDPNLALALHDPSAPALTIGVQERRAASQGGLYYSLTAVIDGQRLVGAGQIYSGTRTVLPDQTVTCVHGPPSHFRIDQTITVSGRIADDGDHTDVEVELSPAAPQFTNDHSCRDEDYRARWFEHAERATRAIDAARIQTRLGNSAQQDEVTVGVYEGRCEPIRARTTGGCDNRGAQTSRAQLLAEPDRPVPAQDRPPTAR